MQYRVYDRQTLAYKDGGYVRSYSIDDDYIVNNNSSLSVVKKVNHDTFPDINVGDIVVLIKDSGAFHKGVITAVDDTEYSILYKSDKELFNDNMLNAFVTAFIDDTVEAAGRFGINVVVEVLKAWFVDTNDKFKRLPIKFLTSGDVFDDTGKPKMLWSWSNDSINIVDWLVELFTLYNLSLSWSIDFNTALPLAKRAPQYVCTLSAITNSGGIIKDNVAMQTITYTTKDLPDATVCVVIDSESKEIINLSSGINYLDPKAGTPDLYVYYHTGDENLSAAFVSYRDRPDSRLSVYFRIRSTNDTPERGFTYSQQSGDTVLRAIIAYDSNFNKVGYINYQPRTQGKYALSFNINSFIIHNANTEDEIAKKRATIKWFAVDYCSDAQKPQLEKGDHATQYDPFDIPSVYYLYEKNGAYSISTNSDLSDKYRVLPIKTVVASYNENNVDTTGNISPQNVAQEKLIPSKFNQAIQIRISADSKMFDFENARYGDEFTIINEQGTISSNYTGRKSSSADKWVTLYFGLGRQNYTDLIQIRLRKSRYSEIYNQYRENKRGI